MWINGGGKAGSREEIMLLYRYRLSEGQEINVGLGRVGPLSPL